MTEWFVKDLSKLTGVSVQTLHHYDRIGLLKPSLRLSNRYRVYSEKDLLKLQQIIALKFFGFELAQIKSLIASEDQALKIFNKQAHLLEKKAAALMQGAKTLRTIIDSVDKYQSIPWTSIIQLIEVYQMTEKLEHSWVKEIFTPDELKQYAEFEAEMKIKHKKEVFEQQWQQLLAELKKNMKHEPNSSIGIQTGKHYMDWINSVYGKKYAHLRTKKWEQGFGEGKGLDDVGLTQEIMAWLEKALDAYWKDRFHGILEQVGTEPNSAVLRLWNQALDDIYGFDDARKHAVYDIALNDDKISNEAKVWLRSIMPS